MMKGEESKGKST